MQREADLSINSETTEHSPKASTPAPFPALFHSFNHQLRLPKSAEEWAEAEQLLSAVATSVLQATTAEEKNLCLSSSMREHLRRGLS